MQLAHQVADVFIGPRPVESTPIASAAGGNGSADLSSYAGRFRSAAEELVSISVLGGRLVADLGGSIPLTAAGPDRFSMDGGATVYFNRGTDGKVSAASVVTADRDTTRYERAIAPPSTSVDIATYAGTFYSPELDVIYTLRANDTTLMLQVPGQIETTLSRSTKDSFGGPLGSAFRFNRSKTNKIDGFLLFAGRVRNLRFTKK